MGSLRRSAGPLGVAVAAAALAAALLFAGVPDADAKAKKKKTCKVSGAVVVAQNSSIVIQVRISIDDADLNDITEYYACSLTDRVPRRFASGLSGEEERTTERFTSSLLTLAGDKVAIPMSTQPASRGLETPEYPGVVVYDAKKGKTLVRYTTAEQAAYADATMSELVLSRTGAVAWALSMGTPKRSQIERFDATTKKPVVLDSDPTVVAGSLAVSTSGTALYWQRGATTLSSPFAP